MLTTSKETLLKKRLIRDAVIAMIVVLALSAGGFVLSNYADDTLADQNTHSGQNNMISSQYQEIQSTLGRQNEVAAYYDKYTKDHNSSFSLNRDTMTNLLANLRKAHHLTSLDVTISSLTDIPESTVALKSGKAVKSTVHITLGALTDNSVYNFIYDLEHTLPGVVIVTELKLAKTGTLSRETALMAINQHNILPMVTGEVSFTWIGITPEENPQGNANERNRRM